MTTVDKLRFLQAARMTNDRKLRLFSFALCRYAIADAKSRHPSQPDWDIYPDWLDWLEILSKKVEDVEHVFTSSNNWSNDHRNPVVGPLVINMPVNMPGNWLQWAVCDSAAISPSIEAAVATVRDIDHCLLTTDRAGHQSYLIDEIFGGFPPKLPRRYAACADCNGTSTKTEQVYQGDNIWLPVQMNCRTCLLHPGRGKDLWASWLTRDVISLAEDAYANRDLVFGELNSEVFRALADAIEESGGLNNPCPVCNGVGLRLGKIAADEVNQACGYCAASGRHIGSMVLHLKEQRTHVRGCWVLDLILGKGVK